MIETPFDAIDFAERPWMPGQPWPLRRETLLPFYQQAAELCEIGEFAFTERSAFRRPMRPTHRSQPPILSANRTFRPMNEPDGEAGGLAEGTLISHLLELRDRLLKAMLAVGVCFIPCAMFMNQLFTFVAEPLKRKLPAGATLIATSVVAPFTVPFKLALVLAVGLAIPCVLYQAWAFVAPGLYRHEKKLAVPLLVSSVLLFYAGAAFAYYAVFPVMLSFFVATTPSGVQMMTDMGSYLDFVMILLLAFGAAFEVPVATVLLVWTGFVKITTLKKNRGFVLLGIFIFAAFVTPPDAISQSAMAVPMYVLYEIGIVMAGLLLKDKIAARAQEEAEEAERGAGV